LPASRALVSIDARALDVAIAIARFARFDVSRAFELSTISRARRFDVAIARRDFDALEDRRRASSSRALY
jgi:hypothetical protein